MQRSNSTTYLIIVMVIMAAASFFFSWKVLIPQYQKNETKIKELDLETQGASAKLDSLNQAKSDIASLGSVYDQILVAIPTDKDEPNTISEIEALANSNGLAVPSIQISDGGVGATTGNTTTANTSNTSGLVTISFNVSGSYDNIAKLTSDLDKDLKFMNIKNLTITAGTNTLSASYQIEAYTLVANSTGGSL